MMLDFQVRPLKLIRKITSLQAMQVLKQEKELVIFVNMY
jgi:hypothetical protein